MISLEDPNFWKRLRLGATVVLTDPITLRECVTGNKQEGGDLNKRYEVNQVEVSTYTDVNARWYFFLLDKDKSLYLLVKTLNKDVAFYIVYKPDQFECGDRQYLVFEQDHEPGHWIFNNPSTPEFRVKDLVFTDQIVNAGVEIDEEPYPVDLVYEKQNPGTIFCETQDTNNQGVKFFTLITEYVCKHERCEQNFALVRETTRNVDSERGGYVELFMGREITIGDLEVIQ